MRGRAFVGTPIALPGTVHPDEPREGDGVDGLVEAHLVLPSEVQDDGRPGLVAEQGPHPIHDLLSLKYPFGQKNRHSDRFQVVEGAVGTREDAPRRLAEEGDRF